MSKKKKQIDQWYHDNIPQREDFKTDKEYLKALKQHWRARYDELRYFSPRDEDYFESQKELQKSKRKRSKKKREFIQEQRKTLKQKHF
jgi:hypothetical protein